MTGSSSSSSSAVVVLLLPRQRTRRSVLFPCLFFLFLFLLVVVVEEVQSKKHHRHRPKAHRANHRRHRAELVEPSLTCHANLSATVSTGSYAKVLVEEANARDDKCRSQRIGESINFDLTTDCRVQRSSGNVYNFTIIARRFADIGVDADRRIPMKCSFHLTASAAGKWNVANDPSVDTVNNGGIIHEKDDTEDIDLYLDPAPVSVGGGGGGSGGGGSGGGGSAGGGSGGGVLGGVQSANDNVIQQKRTEVNEVQIHGHSSSIHPLPAKMLSSSRRGVYEAEVAPKDVLPDGRFVFRPQRFWYLAPIVAAVVFVSIFILVVYVRQKERSRKLLRLSTKKQLAMARTPTLEDIRAIVGDEQKIDRRSNATSGESPPNRDEVDVEQVAPEFDVK